MNSRCIPGCSAATDRSKKGGAPNLVELAQKFVRAVRQTAEFPENALRVPSVDETLNCALLTLVERLSGGGGFDHSGGRGEVALVRFAETLHSLLGKVIENYWEYWKEPEYHGTGLQEGDDEDADDTED